MINFEARCTSLKYGKPYDHGVNLLLLIMYFCIETKINVHVFCSSVNSFVPKRSKFMVIFTGMFVYKSLYWYKIALKSPPIDILKWKTYDPIIYLETGSNL
jgi:hypothetical protein